MKLLIVSLDAYSLFDTSTQFVFGGAELRASLFAKALAKFPNTEVIVATRDQARKSQVFDGVNVVPFPEKKGKGYWEKQQQLSTRIKNRLTGKTNEQVKNDSFSFFETIQPTHLLVLGMSQEAVEAAAYCQKANIPFFFGCASDVDLSENYLEKSAVDISGNKVDGYADVIRNASLVLVQSQQQEELLEQRFGKKGLLLQNPISPEAPKGISPVKTKCDVLWIGKTTSLKRPELFFKLAKLLPELKFRMIMNNSDENRWKQLIAEQPKNVEIIESVPASAVEFYFQQTRLFVNTSFAEGFPNTFLQAGKYGVPIVSAQADPNHLLSEKGCGILTGDQPNALKDAVMELLRDESKYKSCSANARAYVENNHELGRLAPKLYDALRQF